MQEGGRNGRLPFAVLQNLQQTTYNAGHAWCPSVPLLHRRSILCAPPCPVWLISSAAAQSPVVPTPPMGWNSWDSYGTTVREEQVKANADWMAEHLAKYGWQYIVVDIQWYEPNAQGHDYKPGAPLTMDEYGRLMPAIKRFPSSANGAGFRPLAEYIHSKGLKV